MSKRLPTKITRTYSRKVTYQDDTGAFIGVESSMSLTESCAEGETNEMRIIEHGGEMLATVRKSVILSLIRDLPDDEANKLRKLIK